MSTVQNQDLSKGEMTPTPMAQGQKNQEPTSTPKNSNSSNASGEYNIGFLCCCKANNTTPHKYLSQYYTNHTIAVIINIIFYLVAIVAYSRAPRENEDDISLVFVIKFLRIVRIVLAVLLIALIYWLVTIILSQKELKKNDYRLVDKKLFISSIMTWVFTVVNILQVIIAAAMTQGYLKNRRDLRDYDDNGQNRQMAPPRRDDGEDQFYLLTSLFIIIGHLVIAGIMIFQIVKLKKANQAAKSLVSSAGNHNSHGKVEYH